MPTDADPTTVTFDVIGLDDDAVTGDRLVIEPIRDTADQPFELLSVEPTYVCRRGVDGDGLCV